MYKRLASVSELLFRRGQKVVGGAQGHEKITRKKRDNNQAQHRHRRANNAPDEYIINIWSTKHIIKYTYKKRLRLAAMEKNRITGNRELEQVKDGFEKKDGCNQCNPVTLLLL